MDWWNRLKKWIVLIFNKPVPATAPASKPKPPTDLEPFGYAYAVADSEPDIAPQWSLTDQPPSTPMIANRAMRRKTDRDLRKLERARMKFDKLVEPKGELPIKEVRKARGASTAKSEPIEEPENYATLGNVVVVEHYDDDPNNPEVLYEESEFFGLFNFRDTILDQIERHDFYLERMKKYDPDSYGYYRTVGVQLVPYMACDLFGKYKEDKEKITGKMLERYKEEIELPAMFKQYLPSFGCIAYGTNPKVEGWEEKTKYLWPRFFYFTKYERFKTPAEVQLMTGGDVYKMTVWWDTTKKGNKWGTPTDFAIWVSDDGNTLRLLKTCEMRRIVIKKKHGLGRFSIPDRSWHIPDSYGKWARQWGIDPQTHLTHLFCQVVKDLEHAQYGDCRIQVHKGENTAVFNIDARRVPYFFKDRDIILNERGRRVRAFHVVKPFVDKNGVAHKMHYRGLKHFTWAGYTVDITVPGLDHFLLDEFNVGAADMPLKKKVPKGWATQPEVGKRVQNMIKEKVGSYPQQGKHGVDTRPEL